MLFCFWTSTAFRVILSLSMLSIVALGNRSCSLTCGAAVEYVFTDTITQTDRLDSVGGTSHYLDLSTRNC